MNAIDLLQRVQRFISDVLDERTSPPDIGRDHLGREQAALIRHEGLAMAVSMEQLATSIRQRQKSKETIV